MGIPYLQKICSCTIRGEIEIGLVGDKYFEQLEHGFGENTGLGLFLAREILNITGITIVETGDPGKGAPVRDYHAERDVPVPGTPMGQISRRQPMGSTTGTSPR